LSDRALAPALYHVSIYMDVGATQEPLTLPPPSGPDWTSRRQAASVTPCLVVVDRSWSENVHLGILSAIRPLLCFWASPARNQCMVLEILTLVDRLCHFILRSSSRRDSQRPIVLHHTNSISPHLLNRIGWHSGGLVLLHLGLAWSALPTRGMQRRPTPSASTPGTACLSSSRGPCCRLPSACGLGADARGDGDAPSTKLWTLIVSARVRLHLLYAVEKYRTVVIVGETGSGKSTQIPQVMIHTHTREGTHDST
jgi:hypothetical protein